MHFVGNAVQLDTSFRTDPKPAERTGPVARRPISALVSLQGMLRTDVGSGAVPAKLQQEPRLLDQVCCVMPLPDAIGEDRGV